jgi:hypothetical protein
MVEIAIYSPFIAFLLGVVIIDEFWFKFDLDKVCFGFHKARDIVASDQEKANSQLNR